MKWYENVIILHPDLGEEEVTEHLQRIEGIIARIGGEVKRVERWGKKRLAYPINKQRYGHYILMHLYLNPSQVAELKRHYKLLDVLLRHLIITPTEKQVRALTVKGEKPSPPVPAQVEEV